MLTQHPASPARIAGFTLIEFMIAITLSLLVLSALTAAFVANSRSRAEIEKANEQMESGRFALQILTDDLETAGYLSHFDVEKAKGQLPVPGAPPDPCDIGNLSSALLVHVQGYNDLDDTDPAVPSCIANFKKGTDIVVIRRTATCAGGAANCVWVPNAAYFQASLCRGQLDPLLPPVDNWFQLATYTGTTNGPAAGSQPQGGFGRTQRNCTTPAEARQYLTHVYFIATKDTDGSPIPTLMRAELDAGPAFTIVPLARGIEDLQIEYGVDDVNADGAPDKFIAEPDPARSGPDKVAEWRNVMTVRLHVLARNTEPTRDYENTKKYVLAQKAAVQFKDAYKRHVYQTTVRLNNPAGRREQ